MKDVLVMCHANRKQTLPSCVSADNPSKYPPIRAGEYILERLKATTKEG